MALVERYRSPTRERARASLGDSLLLAVRRGKSWRQTRVPCRVSFDLAVDGLSIESANTCRCIDIMPELEAANRLNQLLLTYSENGGEAFSSNALIEGKSALRFCIVNFRTSTGDIEAVQPLVARLGREAHAEAGNQRFVASSRRSG